MGYAISWIAFKDKTAAKVCELLGLAASGESEEEPSGKFSGTLLGNGWYLGVIDEHAHKFVGERALKRVSESGDVVAATVEEHVMFSSAERWKDENLMWRIVHIGENGPDHLEERGTLPPEYAAIKDRLLAAQATEDAERGDVDFMFEAGLELAKSIVGYKHDEIFEGRFERLEPATAGGGLFSRFFGKATGSN